MNRRNRLPRAALLLALLVLAATVTAVAASATNTVIPKHLTGEWVKRGGIRWMVVGSRGKVELHDLAVFHFKFSHVMTHRLSISGASCSGTGTYRWQIPNHQLKLKKIHDPCKDRAAEFSGIWGRSRT